MIFLKKQIIIDVCKLLFGDFLLAHKLLQASRTAKVWKDTPRRKLDTASVW